MVKLFQIDSHCNDSWYALHFFNDCNFLFALLFRPLELRVSCLFLHIHSMLLLFVIYISFTISSVHIIFIAFKIEFETANDTHTKKTQTKIGCGSKEVGSHHVNDFIEVRDKIHLIFSLYFSLFCIAFCPQRSCIKVNGM